MPATLDNVEDWLIAIAQHTRETKEAVQGRTATPAGGGGGGNPARAQEALFEKLGQRLESAMRGAVGTGLGQAKALERRGFSGTLEQARMDYAMEQLGRQFAAVMKPILDGFTYAAVQIERRMRGMGAGQQDQMMGTLLGAGLGFRYGGVGGALAGGMLGNAMMSNNTTGMFSGMAGGAYLGFRAGGPVGAVIGAAAGGVAGSPESYRGEGPGAYYERMRREGGSMAGAGLSTAFEGVSFMFNDMAGNSRKMNPNTRAANVGSEQLARLNSIRGMAGMGAISEETAAPYLKAANAAIDKRNASVGAGGRGRNEVTPFSAEQMDIGGTASRIQEGIIRATAGADYEDGGPFKPIIDLGLKILTVLLKIQNPNYTPPPDSVMA